MSSVELFAFCSFGKIRSACADMIRARGGTDAARGGTDAARIFFQAVLRNRLADGERAMKCLQLQVWLAVATAVITVLAD